jgi:hypothetical protein
VRVGWRKTHNNELNCTAHGMSVRLRVRIDESCNICSRIINLIQNFISEK